MYALLPLLFFLAQPFWETKPPEKWTSLEIDSLLGNSPWAQITGPSPEVVVYLATAQPIEDAEGELRLRKNPLPEPDPDYASFISENHDKDIVLAIPYPALSALGKAEEMRSLEEESVMIVGRKTYKIIGYFPPMRSDPVLRLVFPREVQPTDKTVVFRLYLAGISFPEREVQFRLKDLMYHGKLAI
ncbi:MAG: hypothetical protein ACLQU1_05470 [Bryobacteraceae bacterium]